MGNPIKGITCKIRLREWKCFSAGETVGFWRAVMNLQIM